MKYEFELKEEEGEFFLQTLPERREKKLNKALSNCELARLLWILWFVFDMYKKGFFDLNCQLRTKMRTFSVEP